MASHKPISKPTPAPQPAPKPDHGTRIEPIREAKDYILPSRPPPSEGWPPPPKPPKQ